MTVKVVSRQPCALIESATILALIDFFIVAANNKKRTFVHVRKCRALSALQKKKIKRIEKNE